jgi:hypothetical protein
MQMGSSELIDQASDILYQQEQRTTPWHGEYLTSVRFYLHEAGCLRPGDHRGVDRRIKLRRDWGRRHLTAPGSWARSWEPITITDQDAANLHHMLDFLGQHRGHHQVMISQDWLYIYTNDQGMVDEICDLSYINSSGRPIRITHCDLCGDPGAVYLQESRYQYRTYLRGRRLEGRIARSMREYLHSQDSIRMSPSLKDWGNYWQADQDYCYMYSHYFFDHSDARTVQMLGLISPDIVRKTQPIITDK